MNLINQMLMDLKHRLPDEPENVVKKKDLLKRTSTTSWTTQFVISFCISASIIFALNYFNDQIKYEPKGFVENLPRYSSYLAPSSIDLLMDSKDIGLSKIKHISKNELFYSSVDQVRTIASLIEKNTYSISSSQERPSLIGKIKREPDLALHRINRKENENTYQVSTIPSFVEKSENQRDKDDRINGGATHVDNLVSSSDVNLEKNSTRKSSRKRFNPEKFEKIEVPYLNAERSENVYQQGVGGLREGNVSEAKKSFEHALKISPTHLKSSEALVGILMNENDWIGTEKILLAGIAANRGDISLTMWLAQLYLQQERESEAKKLLSQNVDYAKGNGDYYALMAVLYQNSGEFDLALAAYKKALKTNRSIARWWFGLAVVLEFQSNWPDAQSAYVRALNSGDLPVELLTYAEQRLSFVESQIDAF